MALARVTPLFVLLVACGATPPRPASPPEPTTVRAEEAAPRVSEVDAARYQEALFTHLEAELHLRPEVLDALALSNGDTTVVVAVHTHERFAAWRAEQEAAGTWEQRVAAAEAEEAECLDAHERELESFAEQLDDAQNAYESDPTEENRERVEYAEAELTTFDVTPPECDPWSNLRREGFATWLSVLRMGARPTPAVVDTLSELELVDSGMRVEDLHMSASHDHDRDGAPEVIVRYRRASQFEEMRGGEIEVYAYATELMVLDWQGEVRLEAQLDDEDTDGDFVLHQAYFADVDGDEHPDFVRVWWTLGAACDCSEGALPRARQRELARWPRPEDDAFAFRGWNCEEGDAGEADAEEACTVTEERSVHHYDVESRDWLAP